MIHAPNLLWHGVCGLLRLAYFTTNADGVDFGSAAPLGEPK